MQTPKTVSTVSVKIMKNNWKKQEITTYRRFMSSHDKTNFETLTTSLTYFLKFQWFCLNTIISHYKKIGYNIYVSQQTACLEIKPITVGNFAFLLNRNRTAVGRTTDSMTVPNYPLMRW